YALLLFVIAVLAEGRVRPFRPLAVLARRSYSLYMIHGPLGLTVLSLLSLRTSLPFTLELGIALAVVAAATELCYRFVERPSQRLARRLFPLRRRQAGAARSGGWLRGRVRP
ncbi:MAG: hypothetical protein Q7T71_09075, partial [Herbiconiux sp.]|nr:hypothetical protein [Herbiconiux sp.]